MKCPSCGAENPEGKDFCGDCGAKLPEEMPAPAPEPAVTTPPVPPVPASTAAAAYAPAPAYAAPTAPAAPPAAPPKKKLTGPVIAIVAGIVLLCALSCCVGAYFLFADDGTPGSGEIENTNGEIVVAEEPDRGQIKISKEQGFDDPMEALEDIANQYYQGEDWWYLTIAEEDEYQEYYITPDETTYDKGVILEKREDEWFVTDIYTVDMSKVEPPEEEPEDETDVTPEEYAAYIVDDLLWAIGEGRMEDAYARTMQPLSDYDLSELTGSYTSWEFIGAEEQDDGSVVVIVTMYWSDDTQSNVGALCQWGDEDMYVSDMASVDE